MRDRTDLTIEAMEQLSEQGVHPGEQDGVLTKHTEIDPDIRVTTIRILDARGEALLGRPVGRYVTLEVDGLLDEKAGLPERAARALAGELKKLIRHRYDLRVLVVGLGNEHVTPDRIGPATAEKVRVTSHLFRMFGRDGDPEMSNVSVIVPGVTATTGMETADLIAKTAELIRPDVVLAIDALAARNIGRVSTTIQFTDTGIAPGAGMGNMRRELNEATLGARVIAMGVPTVIDSRTLIREALTAMDVPEADADAYFAARTFDMVVTSTDIDQITASFSEIMANAVNMTLHPGIYS